MRVDVLELESVSVGLCEGDAENVLVGVPLDVCVNEGVGVSV